MGDYSSGSSFAAQHTSAGYCFVCKGGLHTSAVRDSTDRHSAWLIAIVACAGLFACWTTLPLIWDGAYQFADTLLNGRAYSYRYPLTASPFTGRFHSLLLWQPLVLASHCTDNPLTLQAIYGLPFLLAPAFGLLVSWWVVRKHAPGLILWAAFGIAIGPLPGQVFAINDTILQQHLIWPLFVAMFVPLTLPQRLVLTLLALLQLSQPTGIAFCFGVALAAALTIPAQPQHRRRQSIRAAIMFTLCVAGIVKLLVFPDPQAQSEAQIGEVIKRWHDGVEGLPLAGMIFFWLSAAAALLATLNADRERLTRARQLGILAVGSALVGTTIWTGWAVDEHRWRLALDYRRWVLPLSFPFFLAATIEGWAFVRRGAQLALNRPTAARTTLPLVLAATFALVLVIQSTLWLSLVRRLNYEVNNYPEAVVPKSALPWVYGTPLDHWSLPTVYASLQGKTQKKLILFDEAWAKPLTESPPKIPLVEWEAWPIVPRENGYYDFREVERTLKKK